MTSVMGYGFQGQGHFGLGVGLDLGPFYGRSQALDLSASVGNELLREIVEMIARRGRH